MRHKASWCVVLEHPLFIHAMRIVYITGTYCIRSHRGATRRIQREPGVSDSLPLPLLSISISRLSPGGRCSAEPSEATLLKFSVQKFGGGS